VTAGTFISIAGTCGATAVISAIRAEDQARFSSLEGRMARLRDQNVPIGSSAALGFLMCPLCYTGYAIRIVPNCRPIRTHLPSQSSRKCPAGYLLLQYQGEAQ